MGRCPFWTFSAAIRRRIPEKISSPIRAQVNLPSLAPSLHYNITDSAGWSAWWCPRLRSPPCPGGGDNRVDIDPSNCRIKIILGIASKIRSLFRYISIENHDEGSFAVKEKILHWEGVIPMGMRSKNLWNQMKIRCLQQWSYISSNLRNRKDWTKWRKDCWYSFCLSHFVFPSGCL